jgi:hypothetical protein
MPRKALDEQAKAKDAGSAGSRESLSRPAPLTTEGDSLLPLGGGGGPRSKALALANAGIEFSTPGGRSYHAKTWLISRVLCV